MTTLALRQKKSSISLGNVGNSAGRIFGWFSKNTTRNQVRWDLLIFFIVAMVLYLIAFYSIFSYQFMLGRATEELARLTELVSKSEFALQQKKIELLRRNELFESAFEKISVITYIVPSNVASSEVRPRP